MHPPAASSQKLLQCLIKLESEQLRSEAKMELVIMTSELMPKGKPSFLEVVKYPMISQLVQTEGRRKMLAVLVLLVKDFCTSLNVVRNMNEDQMIEAASMLLDECGNFRMEDYLMMFAMAKKGALDVKILDRIDIQVIAQILDDYWKHRHRAGKKAQEEEGDHIDTLGPVMRQLEHMDPTEAKLINQADGLLGAMGELKARFVEWKDEGPKKDE